MTSTLRKTAPVAPGATTGGSSNGSFHPPLSDSTSDGTASEEHPEFVDLSVVLPDGTIKQLTVEYG